MREILTIIAACVVAALAAALAVPPFIDWTQHRAAIAEKLGQGFGGTITLDGPVRLRLLPAPRLTAGALVAERPGLALKAREAALELSAPALLRGAFEFTEIALDRADVTIDPAHLDLAEARRTQVAVARFQLHDATLRLTGAQPVVLDHLDMSGAADTLAGPFRGQGVRRGGRVVDFSFSTAALEDGKLRGKITLDEANAKFHGEATGDLLMRDLGPRFAGQAVVTGVIGGAPARATFALDAGADGLKAEKLDARLGDEDRSLNFSGGFAVGPAGEWSATLSAANLDLDRFRAAYSNVEQSLGASPFMPLDLRVTADSVVLGGDALTNVVFAVARKSDAPPQFTLESGLPGRTRLRYAGAFDSAAARLDGALDVETRDAARLARYIAPALPQVARWLSGGAFARIAYDGRVRANSDGVVLDARRLEVDRSQLSGSIGWRGAKPEARARLTARLAATVIDVDGLPDINGLATAASDDDLTLSLDAQALRVARLGEAPAETGRLRLALKREGGVTALEQLSIAGLGGADLTGSGRMAAQGGGFDFRLDADRLADLAALLRRVAPGPASDAFAARAPALSPAHMTFGVALDGAGAFTQANLAGEAGGVRYSAQVAPAGSGRVQARFGAQAKDAAALLRQAGLPVLPLQGFGAAQIEASGEGPIGGPLATHARADIAGLALRFDGDATFALDHASASGDLVADSADIARLAPLFAIGAPDLSSRVPLKGQARVELDDKGLSLKAIDAQVAGVTTRGEVSRSNAISGRLTFDRLSAPDLAALVLGPPQPAAAGATWPTLRFAAPRFELPNADIALDVAQLDLGAGIAAQDVQVALTLAPGAIQAAEMAMKIAQGKLTGEAMLRREGAAATTRLRLKGAGLTFASGPFSSTVDGALDVGGAGGSMAELVASLAGAAKLQFSSPRIARAATGMLSKAIDAADTAETAPTPGAVADAVSRALDAGVQTLPDFASEATFASGRVSLAPVQARISAAKARLTGAFDLRNGAIDIRETLTLPAPYGWTSAPRIEIAWSGDRAAPIRSVNADALIAALAERAIEREKERNAALEADIRERAFFNKRLKMDRRHDEERRAAEEERRRAAEEARRSSPAPQQSPPPVRREAPSAAPEPPKPEAPKPPRQPPAAFAPAGRGAAPDPSTAGRY